MSQARLGDVSRQKARHSLGILKYTQCFGFILDLDVGMYFCLENCKGDCPIKICLLVCVLKFVSETFSTFKWERRKPISRFHVGLESVGKNGISSAVFFLLPFLSG